MTGISGAGKSTVCGVLKDRGVAAIDTDGDGFNRWVETATMEPVVDAPDPTPPDWVETHAWHIRPDLVRDLSSGGGGTVFLFGAVANEFEVWDHFDRVACLVIDDDVVRARLAGRSTNSFGKHPEDLERVLGWNQDLERLYRELGATIIDGSRPLDEVVEAVLDLSR